MNFLPTAIYRPEFCLRSTVRTAAEAGLEPDRLVFEVVETERMHNREHLRRILAYYRAAGFKVALDDVGSGYSSLAVMADLDPDLIKIDRELVSRAPESAFHRGACASLVKLGQENGQLVLAEGVGARGGVGGDAGPGREPAAGLPLRPPRAGAGRRGEGAGAGVRWIGGDGAGKCVSAWEAR